ncbi:hypothetical protein EWM64_g557 [Hericium alpestre]|uniref:DUF3074 domain-containing protein n=1 Tax=Hericium alpestre TaxID=135208 RepID=A0A4Z0AAT4_9AGAM|nr:hypothetical protein EWM64_g557 [Hericium alpestre]
MSQSSTFQLTIKKDVKSSQLPSEDAILSAAREILASTPTWKRGKSYHNNRVHTYSRAKGTGDGAGWHCRVSEHTADEATFDEFWNTLGKSHSENETKYMKDVKKAELLKEISPSQAIWSMYYEFVHPISPRHFTVLQVAHLDESSPQRHGTFVSVPIDVSDDADMFKREFKATKGTYTSVESIKELPNGKVEWRMATSSSPGGKIPSWIVENTMAGTIAADVTHFLDWYKTVRPKRNDAAVATSQTLPADQADEAAPATAAPVTNTADADLLTSGSPIGLPVPGINPATTAAPSTGVMV